MRIPISVQTRSEHPMMIPSGYAGHPQRLFQNYLRGHKQQEYERRSNAVKHLPKSVWCDLCGNKKCIYTCPASRTDAEIITGVDNIHDDAIDNTDARILTGILYGMDVTLSFALFIIAA